MVYFQYPEEISDQFVSKGKKARSSDFERSNWLKKDVISVSLNSAELFHKNAILSSLAQLDGYVRNSKFEGFDPYDALNSPLLGSLPGFVSRIVATQFFVYSPLNLRKPLRVSIGKDPKAIALLLSAYCKTNLENIFPSDSFPIISQELAGILQSDRTSGYSGSCWGFSFDWQDITRFAKKGLPTIVITAIVANAFLDLYEITHDKSYLQIAQSSCDFILNDLNITESEDGICFSYTPLDHHIVHNANLLGAGLLARVYSLTGDANLIQYSRKAFEFSVQHQEENGSWAYSENLKSKSKRYQIDFHQGFILDSIMDFIQYTKPSNGMYERALCKGAKFYQEFQFDDLGRSMWRFPIRWPIDIHNQAQGIITFSRLSRFDRKYLSFAIRIALWTMDNMQDPQGYFYYHKYPIGSNKIPYMRWGQAWMMLALSQIFRSIEA